MCAHLAISAASEATGAMSGVCAVAVGALAGLIGLKVSFAAPPRAPKKRQPRNGVTERATALLLRAARSRADVYPKPSAARVGREGPAGDQFPLL